jgi:hypothetical protein
MFGNKFFGIKLFIGFGLFAASCFLCHKQGASINPSPTFAETLAPQYEGETLWIPRATVEKVEGELFVIRCNDRSIPVHGKNHGLQKGDAVELTGIFHSDPVRLDLLQVRPIRFHWWWWLSAASALPVILGVLFLFFRRFRIRPRAWEARWPTS